MRAAAATVVLLALLVERAPHAAGQMETPLKGQGTPANGTTEVFLSVYLDRLLAVDDQNYRQAFEAVFYFYLTWRDTFAYTTVRKTTADMRAGTYTCQHPCSDWVGALSCCDGIYQPTFFFRNAFSFPQDRAAGYKLYALPPPNSSVLWTQFVHGVFYQPMDLSHYPFDAWDLLLTLEFLDTSGPDQSGVEVRLSSASEQLYTYGKGDAVSQWGVESISMKIMKVDSVAWFKTYSTQPSNLGDPLGLTNSDAAMLRGCPPGATEIQDSRTVTMVIIKVRIYRFWRYSMLNNVLPVMMVGLLSFIVFFLERKELATRMGVVVTLFLALTAVQFVIAEHQPSTHYAMPTQQLVVCTYVLLSLIALESIVVYYVETWKQATQAAAQRRQARDRYLAMRRVIKEEQAAAQKPAATDELQGSLPTTKLPSSDQHVVRFAESAAAEAVQEVQAASAAAESAACHRQCSRAQGQPDGNTSVGAQRSQPAALAARRLTRAQSLRLDEAYDAWLAFVLDQVALALLLAGYVVAVVLIFTLQNGYIDLFD